MLNEADERIARQFSGRELREKAGARIKEACEEEGINAEVERIARVAKGYHIRVGQIRHSTKARARQTAAIFQAALDPQESMQVMEGLKPLDDVTALSTEDLFNQDMMLVGHLPFMERLTSYLITGSIEKRVFKFQNGGIVRLDRDPESGDWFIKWALMPKIA